MGLLLLLGDFPLDRGRLSPCPNLHGSPPPGPYDLSSYGELPTPAPYGDLPANPARGDSFVIPGQPAADSHVHPDSSVHPDIPPQPEQHHRPPPPAYPVDPNSYGPTPPKANMRLQSLKENLLPVQREHEAAMP